MSELNFETPPWQIFLKKYDMLYDYSPFYMTPKFQDHWKLVTQYIYIYIYI